MVISSGHKIGSYEFIVVLITDNNTLVSLPQNRVSNEEFKIWNLQTANLKYTLKPQKNQDSYLDSEFNFLTVSPNGKNLITKGNLGIQTWELATGHLKNTINTIEIKGDILAFSPDGKILATGGVEDSNINIRQIASE
ncbi:MAG: hypothetical protein N2235_19200 [Fischerella sp.]|nr:hypothetical protein [Fischerella sp.]